MFSLQELKTSGKPFPAFISNHALTKNSSASVDKIFPKIGLPNKKEKIVINTFNLRTLGADKLLKSALLRFKTNFTEWNNNRGGINSDELKFSELFKVSKAITIIDELISRLTHGRYVEYTSESIILTHPIVSYDGVILAKEGVDAYDVVKQLLNDISNYYNASEIEIIKLNDIKKQCSKNTSIVFSSDNLIGAWDMATISMRGVKSCMRWEHEQSSSLIGSIADPYCGLIYLTNNSKTPYGTKMLFRALVRVIINHDGKPALMLDRIYSCFYKNKPDECNSLDKQIRTIFMDYLSKKAKCPVLDSVNDKIKILDNYKIPYPEIYDSLQANEKSYLDTKLPYAILLNNEQSNLVKKIKADSNIKNATKKSGVKSLSRIKLKKPKLTNAEAAW